MNTKKFPEIFKIMIRYPGFQFNAMVSKFSFHDSFTIHHESSNENDHLTVYIYNPTGRPRSLPLVLPALSSAALPSMPVSFICHSRENGPFERRVKIGVCVDWLRSFIPTWRWHSRPSRGTTRRPLCYHA